MNDAQSRGLGTWVVGGLLLAVAVYPLLERERAARHNAACVRRLQSALNQRAAPLDVDVALSLRVRRLSGLLASWETIGGCGAGSSTGSGGAVKWIGRSTHGGLFNLQLMGSYLHLPDGYNLSLSTQVSRDLGEKWNIGLSVPLLYKYYRDYYGLPVDISNGGLGDISAFITRKFGEINATALTLSVGAPSGVHDAKYKNDYLTQEKQLGAGRPSAGLMLDYTFDEDWGLALLGASGSYRGGENDLGNYRAPVANVYGYCGYFMGPWVPSLGLTLQRFFGVDRDRNVEQQVQLSSVTGTLALEWSTDWIAILAGASLPLGFEATKPAEGDIHEPLGNGFQPWTVAIGLSVSPF